MWIARGLFRLWAVASLLWAAMWLTAGFLNGVSDTVVIALAPPVAVLMVGSALGWVAAGFSRG